MEGSLVGEEGWAELAVGGLLIVAGVVEGGTGCRVESKFTCWPI